ncbi:hypothetical protein ABT095_25370 [Kitasatospora sp. NPDC002227]|uniref:hypothetical protein n=1 Tax=Kitasatospora sp. NPDC002227 TaxID=3154773 RepID=UPI003330B59E
MATLDVGREVVLPGEPGVWVGRQGESAALAAGREKGAVLVVAGRPGSGRTALAVRFARSVAADYPDGVLYTRLSAPDGTPVPPGRAARRLLEQLGAEPTAELLPGGAPDEPDPACAALRAELADRRVLLLLDDVRDAGQLRPLLPGEPGCLVLATTAGPISGIEGIDPVILGGLGLTAATELLSGLVGGTRISCDPVGAAKLAESCGAGPAALRLMAGWLRADGKAAVTDAASALAAVTGPAEPGGRAGRRKGKGKNGRRAAQPPTELELEQLARAADLPVDADTELDVGTGVGLDGVPRIALLAPPVVAGPPAQAATAPAAAGADRARGKTARRRPVAPDRPGAAAAGGPDATGRSGGSATPVAAGAVPVADGDPLTGAFLLGYRALPAGQGRMLRMLTLAPGQVADLRTASALVGCPAPEAGGLLAKLAERELLDLEPPAGDGTLRYRLPGRLYARLVALRESTDRPAEVQLARARLLERLVRLVDSARELLETGSVADPLPGPLRLRGVGHARLWLGEERELLLGAVAEAIGQADLDGSAGRLVTALLRALPLTGAAAPAELHGLHELVREVAGRSGDSRRVTAALLNLGDLQAAAGRWEPAAERYRAALETARADGDEPACARALESVAGCHRAQGDAVRAADWYGRALALRQSLGERAAEARLLARVAEAHTAQRRFEEAEREYRAAVGLLRRLDDVAGQTAVAAALGRLRAQVEGERLRVTSE